ncbi:hypothetical protein [Streptomyces sp. NPDC088725]|uniref:hypothetical protein n=1 Tax=Streptomyces sp. NPDC088725 TaxID=3365873 RepID=UPI003812EBAD
MAFGRGKKVEEPPVEPVAWANVYQFIVSNVERPPTTKRKRAVFGPRAIRVPKNGRDYRVNAPCAYLAPRSRSAEQPAEPGIALYEDPGAQRLLCSVDAPNEVDGERHHTVRDGQGHIIGTLRRIPPRRPFRHTWRIDQPGHPEIIGRNELGSGSSTAENVGRVAVVLALGLVGSAISGGDGGERSPRHRTLEWHADNKVVMTSQEGAEVKIPADWLDRRLAFAFAVLGDH